MSPLTYSGADWRETLSRNVTVSLEFAERDLQNDPTADSQVLWLVRDALAECRRLLASHPDDRSDSERLDWVQRTLATDDVEFFGNADGTVLFTLSGDHPLALKQQSSVRAAIDAARLASPGEDDNAARAYLDAERERPASEARPPGEDHE